MEEREVPSSLMEDQSSIDSLIQRFETLLGEIEQYQQKLEDLGRKDRVKWGGFDKIVRSDLQSAKKLAQSAASGSPQPQALRSSNIPYHETTWNAAKRSTGPVAFKESFSWRPPPKRWKKAIGTGEYHGRDHAAIVDVVANEGLEWIKVSSLTEKRLRFDLAKEGWSRSDTEEDDNDEDGTNRAGDSDVSSEIPIIRTAEGLIKAAQANRVRYQHPRVKIVLPRITSSSPDTDRIFDKIRAKGCTLELGSDSNTDIPSIGHALRALDDIDEHADLTPTVNIDCTVLLSLVSDISHMKKCEEPWLHPHVKAQAQLEQEDQLLSANLYPALADRQLVCTKEAATQMDTIVDTVGNAAEKRRTILLLTREVTVPQEQSATRREDFQRLSEHDVPVTFRFPIIVVDKDEALIGTSEGFSARISSVVSGQLTAVNASVFMYGWRTGRTTVTSNRTAMHQVEELIEASRSPDGADDRVRGPIAWFIPVARSLVGMDRGRKFLGQGKKSDSEAGVDEVG